MSDNPEIPERWKNWSADERRQWAAQTLNLALGSDHPLVDQLVSIMQNQGERAVHEFMFKLRMSGQWP